jgi:hypothetical protein
MQGGAFGGVETRIPAASRVPDPPRPILGQRGLVATGTTPRKR